MSLRLDEIVGNDRARRLLKASVFAAKKRSITPPHALFIGPQGLGKTTLAKAIADELPSATFQRVVGRVKTKHLSELLVGTTFRGDKITVLFWDEIHMISPTSVPILLVAMEEKQLQMPVGPDVITMNLGNFMLIGATTLPSRLARPLLDRFGLKIEVRLYSIEELVAIALLEKENQFRFTQKALKEIAMRSRGTPRVMLALTRNVSDTVDRQAGICKVKRAVAAMEGLEVYSHGLTPRDIEYIRALDSSRVASLRKLAAMTGHESQVLVIDIEPWLFKLGALTITTGGRQLTRRGRELVEQMESVEI